MRDINYSCIFSSQIINVNTKKFLPYAVVVDKMERDTVVQKDNTIEYSNSYLGFIVDLIIHSISYDMIEICMRMCRNSLSYIHIFSLL